MLSIQVIALALLHLVICKEDAYSQGWQIRVLMGMGMSEYIYTCLYLHETAGLRIGVHWTC